MGEVESEREVRADVLRRIRRAGEILERGGWFAADAALCVLEGMEITFRPEPSRQPEVRKGSGTRRAHKPCSPKARFRRKRSTPARRSSPR